MAAPNLLRGIAPIAAHLGISKRQAAHLDQQRQLPTFRMPHDAYLYATVGGLNEWLFIASHPPSAQPS